MSTDRPCYFLNHSERGVALISVLWYTALIALMAASFLATVRTEMKLVRNIGVAVQLGQLAEAAIWRGVYALANDKGDDYWRVDGTAYVLQLAGERVGLTIQDQSGSIDLNRASLDQLQRVLRGMGAEESVVRAVAAAIIDWRDADSMLTEAGAEIAQYQQIGDQQGPANKPFQSVEELRRVLGVTPNLYEQMARVVTVFAHRSQPRTEASPGELVALLGDPGRVEGIPANDNAEQQQKIVEARAEPGGVYLITAKVMRGNARMVLRAIIALSPNMLEYFVLDWQKTAWEGGDEIAGLAVT